MKRRLPVGAEAIDGGVHFRVWAPKRRRVDVAVEGGQEVRLSAMEGGYFEGFARGLGAGARYRFRLDGGDAFPDPASRFQPEGPHGPSQVIDPSTYRFRDEGWKGASIRGQVIYEMHVGTFTREGTWAAAAEELDELASVGVTVVEMMPIAEFAGAFGWGYDGVDLFAPTHLYGTPDDLRRFVDRAHAAGIAVILDVVYNHLGPSGNYLSQYSDTYFTDRYQTDWGPAVNYDGEGSAAVRELVIANAAYWIDELHLDGLRLDATQNIYDAGGGEHILAAITRSAREAARGRSTIVVAENEPQETKLVRPVTEGGYGMDGLWNDDYHHSAMVALTKRNEAYYTDYRGSPQELVSAMKHGYLYQGQRYTWQKQRRGTPALDLAPEAFVVFLENHDQVANSLRGERSHALGSLALHRALTALTLLGPATPMLFQGQEFRSSAPFLYFADHDEELAERVRAGRAEFLAQFPSMALPETAALLPDPGARATFERCKLDLAERRAHAEFYMLTRDLLALRRRDPVLSAPRPRGVDGAVLSPDALVLRFFGDRGDDRLLVVNLGRDLRLDPAPEPLLAPPFGKRWKQALSTEEARYGGLGSPPPETEEGWRLTAESAAFLIPGELERTP